MQLRVVSSVAEALPLLRDAQKSALRAAMGTKDPPASASVSPSTATKRLAAAAPQQSQQAAPLLLQPKREGQNLSTRSGEQGASVGTSSNSDPTFTSLSGGGSSGSGSGSGSSTPSASAPFFGVEMVILAHDALLSAALRPPQSGQQQHSAAVAEGSATSGDSASTTSEGSQVDSVTVLASQLSQSQQLIDLSLQAVWGRRHRLPIVLLCDNGESGPSLPAMALLRHASLTVLPRPLSRQVTEHKLSIVLRIIEDNRQSLMLARRAHQLDRVLRAMLKEQVQAGGGGMGASATAATSGGGGALTSTSEEFRLSSG